MKEEVDIRREDIWACECGHFSTIDCVDCGTCKRKRPDPKRIQRKRTKAWKMPVRTIYCGRPTRWGNPHVIGWCPTCNVIHTRDAAIDAYRKGLTADLVEDIRNELRCHDLACWCPPDEACHVDVLLEVANS